MKRPTCYDARITFRLPAAWLLNLETLAEKRGESVSDLLRHCAFEGLQYMGRMHREFHRGFEAGQKAACASEEREVE